MLPLQIQNDTVKIPNSEFVFPSRPQYPVTTCYEKRALPKGFKPSKYSVICARGNAIKNHPGNIRFLELVDEHLPSYASASSKLEKSLIVSSIIDSIRRLAPEGAFVKEEKGSWYEMGDHHGREKVGQRLRDLLSNKYSSSSNAKKRRRREDEAHLIQKLDQVVVQTPSCLNLEKRIQQLTDQDATDEELQTVFNQANMELLRKIKEQNLCSDAQQQALNSSASSLNSTTSSKNKRKFECDYDEDDSSSSSFDPIPLYYF